MSTCSSVASNRSGRASCKISLVLVEVHTTQIAKQENKDTT